MTPDDYERWTGKARERLQAGMEAAAERFGLGSHERYEIDLEAVTIRFFDANDVEQVRADIQVAGSWAPHSQTWMWGWENDSVPEAAVSRLAPIAEAGRTNDIAALQAYVSECDEAGAWSLAALAADIVDADCVYRTGSDRNRAFLLLFNLRKPG
jgi:hypothetical protein